MEHFERDADGRESPARQMPTWTKVVADRPMRGRDRRRMLALFVFWSVAAMPAERKHRIAWVCTLLTRVPIRN
jgi:hypothetical protein